MDDLDEFGLPKKAGRGRPVNPATFRGTARTKEFKRVRGAWPEAFENMRIGDSKTVTKFFRQRDYDPRLAAAWFETQKEAIKKAKSRVMNKTPALRLRQYKVSHSDVATKDMDRTVSTTLTRIV